MKAKYILFALPALLLAFSCDKHEKEEPDHRTLEYSLNVSNDNYTETTVLEGIGDTQIDKVLNQPDWVSEVKRENALERGSMVVDVTVKSDPTLEGIRSAQISIQMTSGATAILSISQNAGLPIGFNDGESPSRNKKFEENWAAAESVSLVIEAYKENGKDKVRTQDVPLPWNYHAPGRQCNIPDETLENMMTNKDNWVLAFNTTGIEEPSCVHTNYFGLYNANQGKLRIFYYWPQELIPESGANDHLWYVRFKGNQATHNSTSYAIPLNHEVSELDPAFDKFEKKAGEYYSTAIAPQTANDQLITPEVGWWAFDVQMEAMRKDNFFDKYQQITIGMTLMDEQSIVLSSLIKGTLSGKMAGDMNLKALLPASTNGWGYSVPYIGSLLSSFMNNKFVLDYFFNGTAGWPKGKKASEINGRDDMGNGDGAFVPRPRFVAGAGVVWVGIGCVISMLGTLGKDLGKTGSKDEDKEKLGHLDLTVGLDLSATMETVGLIRSKRSHKVPKISLPREYFKVGPKTKSADIGEQMGKGLWNISDDPVVYIVKDAYWSNKAQATYYSRKETDWVRNGKTMAEYDISMSPHQLGLRLISFFDPTSIGPVVINEDLFGHPTDFTVSVSCGVYPGTQAGYTDWFREATSMEVNPLTLSTAAKDQKVSTGNVAGAVKAPFRILKAPYNNSLFKAEFENPYPETIATRLSEQDVYGGQYQRRYYGTSLFYCNPEANTATVDQVQFVADPQIFVPYNEKRRVITDPDIPDMVVSVNIMFRSQSPVETEPTWKTYTLRYLPRIEYISVTDVKNIADRILNTYNGGQSSDIEYTTCQVHNSIISEYSKEITRQLSK